jgi:[acyl-carrier-protein] S-malonyltransferase
MIGNGAKPIDLTNLRSHKLKDTTTMTTAWVFPGQGSQAIGMGADLLGRPAAEEALDRAAAILGWSVLDVCSGDLEILSKTFYTQPCLYVVEALLVDGLRERGQEPPSYLAGHSLGEYVALYAAGVFEFEAGLRLVQRRSELMSQAKEGMMAALMGFDRGELDAAIAVTEGVVLANDNNPGQAVISGTAEGVQHILDTVKMKRGVPLKVSGAFHSPLMAEASATFQASLDATKFATASIPVLSNVDPEATIDPVLLKARLARQMTGSVRWTETSRALASLGVSRVVEVGPGKVLTGLIKRTCPDLELANIETLDQS